MAEFFSAPDKNPSVPQIQRSRQRFRGPRDSSKHNLEAAQFYYDVERLYERFKEISLHFSDNCNSLVDGAPMPVGATPTYVPVFVPGVQELAKEISLLENRIKSLEK